ncbi:MAG: M23 family metallopeptidase [Ruminococcaceae bacterium]|nr:M23 family metallopeptidase [Oscillospiraceae bacterium]
MLYITINSRSVKKAMIAVAVIAFATMLLCMWALAAQTSHETPVSDGDISAADTEDVPTFKVISPTELSAAESGVTRGETDEPAVPAHVSLYPFTISRSVSLPLENAVISSPFGFRDHPINGKYSFHSGLDLAAPEGTDIRAMLDGVVVTAKYASDYGNYAVIDHGEFQTLYAHCLTLNVSAGQQVSAGQKIAEVGSTGRATGSHLHVEFRCNGQRYDPAVVLGDSYS